ncbi:hypothetical protein AAG906_016507 [Vitis piasezkii]
MASTLSTSERTPVLQSLPTQKSSRDGDSKEPGASSHPPLHGGGELSMHGTYIRNGLNPITNLMALITCLKVMVFLLLENPIFHAEVDLSEKQEFTVVMKNPLQVYFIS